MNILDRYVWREIIMSTSAVILVLLIILLGNTSLRILSKIVEGSLPDTVLLPMIAANMVHYVTILLPLSLYLGILLAIGRLYKDSEMAALAACGIGTRRLYRPVLLAAIPLALLAALLSLFAGPWVSAVQQTLKQKAEQRSELSGILAGRFNPAQNGQGMLFVERLSDDRNNMQRVFLQGKGSLYGEPAVIVETAEHAYQELQGDPAKKYLVFNQGYLHVISRHDQSARITRFAEHGLALREQVPTTVQLKTGATSTPALWGASEPELNAELQWRLSVPVACLLLALMALPLSYTTPRKGRYAKVGFGILIYLLYTNLLGIARALVEREQAPAWLGMAWAHLLLIVLVLFMLRYQQIMLAQHRWKRFILSGR